MIEAGANALVAGSAVFGAKSYAEGKVRCAMHVDLSNSYFSGLFCS